MPVNIVSYIKKDYIRSMAEKGIRLDGRGIDEMRELTVEKPYLGSAEGSARVKLGKTDVIVGVKIDPGSPFSDRPNLGVLISTAEMAPISSPDFEMGPPRPPAIELARVTDRSIRESQTIDLAPLCIEEGEKVWMVFIDIHPLDYHGNLFDACQYGAMAALSTAMVPWSKLDESKEDVPLGTQTAPVSLTAVKVGSKVLIDPNLDEDEVADARITVSTDENGDIRAMQKGLNGSFTIDEIKYVVKLSEELGSKVRPKLME
ncbi:MAG: exosome complex protein Rrp42 [Thermoplasmata archaeon]|nr:MAG: exosome complex protein Rrp42 [Thermoplasmata archaeon]